MLNIIPLLVSLHAAPADLTNNCNDMLSSIAEAAGSFELSSSQDGTLKGLREGLSLTATCSDDGYVLELQGGRGDFVSVTFEHIGDELVFELNGWFPGLGSASRDVRVDAAGRGEIVFAAVGQKYAAAIRTDLLGNDLGGEKGQPDLVNREFAGRLRASEAWLEAHRLAFSVVEDRSETGAQVASISASAVVAPRKNKSIFTMGVACAGAMVVCGAAAVSGLPPAAVACYKESAGCALSALCAWQSCLD